MRQEDDLGRIIGKAAREARMALGLTQDMVAKRLNTSTEFYARVERGAAKPSIDLFSRMVRVLGVTADTLLGLHGAHPRQRSLAQGQYYH